LVLALDALLQLWHLPNPQLQLLLPLLALLLILVPLLLN
jgi:hypothetical protein